MPLLKWQVFMMYLKKKKKILLDLFPHLVWYTTNKITNINTLGKKKPWTNTLLNHLLFVIPHKGFWGKTTYLSHCKAISCAQPSSNHSTDFQWDFYLGSNWAIPKLWSSFQPILLLIWVCALGCYHAGWIISFSCLSEACRFYAKIDWYLELFMIHSYID